MGIASYRRGSRAIAASIQSDYEPGRAASEARTLTETLRMTIDHQTQEIAKLRGNLVLAREGKKRNFKAWCELEAHFKGYRRNTAAMVRNLIDANTEKERQRGKLARCVREHLTPEQWLRWSAEDMTTEGRCIIC